MRVSGIHPIVRASIDLGGLGAILNSVMAWTTPLLSFIGLVLAMFWYAAQLYESKLVQDWMTKKLVSTALHHMPTAVAVIKALPDHEVEHMPAIEQDATLGAMVAEASAPPQSQSGEGPALSRP